MKKKAKKKVKKTVKKTTKKVVAKKTAKKKTVKRKTTKKVGLTQIKYEVSAALEDIVKEKKLTRPQIVKKLWVYIKANKLQDPKKRRMIVPDEKLAKVIGSRPVDMLKLATHLNKHILKS